MDSLTLNEEMEKFLTISAMTKVLMHGFDGPTNMDRNDLYELAYIENELESWLNMGIAVDDIRENAHSILSCVQFIEQSLTEENVELILKAKIKKHAKFNKLKYGRKEAYPELTSLEVTQLISSVPSYVRAVQVDTIDKVAIATILLKNTRHWMNKLKNAEIYGRYDILSEFDAQLTSIEQVVEHGTKLEVLHALASAEKLYINNKYDVEAHVSNIRLHAILDGESPFYISY